MAVQLHEPERHGGRVAVEHHRRVRTDPRTAEEPFDRRGIGQPVVGVLEVGVHIPQNGPVNVPVVVGGRADVDFNHPYTRVGKVSFQPLRIDEHPVAGAWARLGDSLF
jgi:hypothetical protein